MVAIATIGAALKQCKQCGENKSLRDFNTHPKTRDGREGKCRKCRNRRANYNYIRTHKNDPRHKDLIMVKQPIIRDEKPYKVGDPWFIFD